MSTQMTTEAAIKLQHQLAFGPELDATAKQNFIAELAPRIGEKLPGAWNQETVSRFLDVLQIYARKLDGDDWCDLVCRGIEPGVIRLSDSEMEAVKGGVFFLMAVPMYAAVSIIATEVIAIAVYANYSY